MLYLLIGSAGIASTLYTLWRAAQAEKRAISAEAKATLATENANRWKSELETTRATYIDTLSRKDQEIKVLEGQRKDAIDELENSACPGALRSAIRLSLGIE